VVRDYELMVVFDPNLDETGLEAQKDRIAGSIAQRQGTIVGIDEWGRRRLAYPIGRLRDGVYVLYRLNLTPGTTVEIERGLKLMESVVRHLLVRVEEHAAPARPTPSPTPAAEVTPAAEETPTAEADVPAAEQPEAAAV
jgi:small subunit ribosomal protein S6